MEFTVLDGWLVFVAVVLGVGVCNLLANFAFVRWVAKRAAQVDPPPRVSVLVPARNEALNIEACITALLDQDYPHYDVIALDDDSTDATGSILDRMAASNPRLHVIHNRQALPANVNGKSRACQMLAEHSSGDWLLFVDADTVHRADSVRAGVERAAGLGVALFTAIPKQRIGTWGERLFVPAGFTLIYNAISMWRMFLARGWRHGTAAAIGQYVLVRRDAYFASGGHAAVQNKILDDVSLGQLIKRNGHRIALADADWVSCRMYRGWGDMVQGFSKNAFAILNGSLVLSAAFIAACLLLFHVPLLYAATCVAGAHNCAPWPTLAAPVFALANFMLVARRIGQPWWTGLLYPVQLLIGIGILINSIRWRITGKAQWKGRALTES